MLRGVTGEKTSPKSCLRQNNSYIVHVVGLEGIVPPIVRPWWLRDVGRGVCYQTINKN